MRIAVDHRDAILQSAAKLFARKPYHEVLMDDVAEQTGIAKGTVYRHFPNKEELFAALGMRYLDTMGAECAQAAALVKEHPFERLRIMLTRLAELFTEQRDFFQVMQRHECNVSRKHSEFMERRTVIQDAFMRVIEEAAARKELSLPFDAAHAANMLLGMNRSLLLFSDPPAEPARVAEMALHIFLNGLVSKSPAPKETKKAVRRRVVEIALVAVAALPLLLSGCGEAGAADGDAPKKVATAAPGAPPAAGGAPQKRLYPVTARPVAVQPLHYELDAIGSVEAQDVYRIEARVSGTLYEVNFNEGQEVTTDTVLCKIAPEAYKFMAMKQKAMHEQSVAMLHDAERKLTNDVERNRIKKDEAEMEVARRVEVRKKGAISNEELQLYQSHYDVAKLEVKDSTEAAKTQIESLKAAIDQNFALWQIAEDDVRKSIVHPPIKGVIEQRFVTNGLFATPGMLLATMVDKTHLKLKFKVSEKDSAVVKPGTQVNFDVPAFPGTKFQAEVYRVGDQLDVDSRVVTCWAMVRTGLEQLKPGYFASVRLLTGGNERAVVIPSTALLPTEKGFVAYVVVNGKAEQRKLQAGLTVSNNSIEILSGLTEGELLVVEGANALQPGVSVKIVNEAENNGAALNGGAQ